MKGYQRAHKSAQAGSLADVPRERGKRAPPLEMHGDQGDGSSYCPQGRRSYMVTTDPVKVTCKSCRKLMEGKS